MNHIQFEIGGELRGFRMGVGFLGDVLDYLKVDIVEFGDMVVKNPFKLQPAILYYAHYHDCKRKSLPTDFTIEDVEDWIEEVESGVFNENILKASVILHDSLVKHLPKTDKKEKTAKKK